MAMVPCKNEKIAALTNWVNPNSADPSVRYVSFFLNDGTAIRTLQNYYQPLPKPCAYSLATL